MTDDSLRLLAVTSHRAHELAEPLRAADGPVHVVHIDPTGFLSRNLAAIRDTRRAIREHDPDVVLSDSHELLGFLVALVCVLSRVPFVFRFKGDYWRGFADTHAVRESNDLGSRLVYGVGALLNRFIYATAAGYIAVSEALGETVVERTGRSPDRVAVVGVPLVPGVEDGTARAARERYGIEEPVVILTVTNLSYGGKADGARTVLEGMRSVLERDEDVAYVLAGGGDYLPEIRAFVDRTVADPSVRSRIHVLGFVDRVADLYALADGFVYVSFLDGYPRAVLEAQQAGLPVVANADHGMVEQVDHGDSGLLLERPTPGSVAEAVTRLLASPDERERMGSNGRARARRENHPEVVGRALRAAVAAVLQPVADRESKGGESVRRVTTRLGGR